jgi:hypothetical protein
MPGLDPGIRDKPGHDGAEYWLFSIPFYMISIM